MKDRFGAVVDSNRNIQGLTLKHFPAKARGADTLVHPVSLHVVYFFSQGERNTFCLSFFKKALQRSLVVCPTMPCYAIFQRCGYPTCGMLNRKARKRAVNIRKRFSIQNPRSKKKVFGRDVHMIRFSPSLGPKCFQRPRRGSGSVSTSPK